MAGARCGTAGPADACRPGAGRPNSPAAPRLPGPAARASMAASPRGVPIPGLGNGWFMDVTLCVLLWAHEGREAAAGDYEDRVLTLLADHGRGAIEFCVLALLRNEERYGLD